MAINRDVTACRLARMDQTSRQQRNQTNLGRYLRLGNWPSSEIRRPLTQKPRILACDQPMDRDNATWLSDLRDPAGRQSAALDDLRQLLVRGLAKALKGKADGDAFFDDIAQEAVLKVLDKLDTFRGESKFTSWAMTVAVRTAITELRRRKWSEVSLDQLASQEDIARPLEPTDIEAGPQQQTQQKAILSSLADAIQQTLTAKQREALLAELGGMPQEEIARRTGSNRNAIYKMMHDARKRLKTTIKSQGYSSVDVRIAFDF